MQTAYGFAAIVLMVAEMSAAQSVGPMDPTTPGRPLYQNRVVQKALELAFGISQLGMGRDGLAEAGCSIEYKNGKIYTAHWVNSLHDDRANELKIASDEYTIAILHTHGNRDLPEPGPGDITPTVYIPDFVKSAHALYVTLPRTGTNGGPNHYIKLQ